MLLADSLFSSHNDKLYVCTSVLCWRREEKKKKEKSVNFHMGMDHHHHHDSPGGFFFFRSIPIHYYPERGRKEPVWVSHVCGVDAGEKKIYTYMYVRMSGEWWRIDGCFCWRRGRSRKLQLFPFPWNTYILYTHKPYLSRKKEAIRTKL